MTTRGILTTLIAAVVVAGTAACGTSDAEALCADLDAGTVPIQAIDAWSGVDESDPQGTLLRARDVIRADCPQHEAAAASIDAIMNPALGAWGSESDVGVPDGGDTGPAPVPAQQDVTVELTVEGDGVDEATVSWSAGGSAGGGDVTGLPFTRTETMGAADTATVTAVTTSGTDGSLTCTIRDAATGSVITEDAATSGGGPSGFASVAC